jgi:hypothetical protein
MTGVPAERTLPCREAWPNSLISQKTGRTKSEPGASNIMAYMHHLLGAGDNAVRRLNIFASYGLSAVIAMSRLDYSDFDNRPFVAGGHRS